MPKRPIMIKIVKQLLTPNPPNPPYPPNPPVHP